MTTPRDSEFGSDPLHELVPHLRAEAGVSTVIEQGSLAPYTTWRVGGPADVLCVADTVEALTVTARLAAAGQVEWRVLGRGSNVLVSDAGVEGLVIINRSSGMGIEGTHLSGDAGLLLSTLAKRAARAGLTGMEWCAGIPGTVGGALVSNAGAHGGAMADTVRRVELLATNAAPRWEPAEYLALAYRHSRLRESRPMREVILRAEFELQEDDPAAIQTRMLEQKRQRQATQPLSSASAGSVFKNPPGDSAARLVDQAGLKGMCVGGATVSTRHANFMVTSEGACASDVFSLIELVRDRVRRRFGVELDLEVQPIGRKAPAFA